MRGFICTIAWQHEVGEGGAIDGVRVYPSIESLKRDHPYFEECGITEIEMREVRTVVEQDIFKGVKVELKLSEGGEVE